MSASGAGDGSAAVGRRIEQARRERGLTQAELAARIGVSLGMVDRYETGRADPSDKLPVIAEVTGRPASWFMSSGEDEGDGRVMAEFPTGVGPRIAQARKLRGLTRRELADAVGVSLGRIERYESGAEDPSDLVARIAAALEEPASWLRSGGPRPQAGDEGDLAPGTTERQAGEGGAMNDTSPTEPEAVSTVTAQSPLPVPPLEIKYEDLPRKTLGYQPKATADLFEEVAETYRRLWDDRRQLGHRLEKLQAELAEEREKHGSAPADTELADKLQKADASRHQLALQLEQVTAALAGSREQESQLSHQVSELETELRLLQERAAAATDRLAQSNKELERFREQERALAESLVWARHTASELSEKAAQEAKQIVGDAKKKAAELLSEAQREVERLTGERHRLETLANDFQEDLSGFLLGTLERLKGRAAATAPTDEPAPETTADGGGQKATTAPQS